MKININKRYRSLLMKQVGRRRRDDYTDGAVRIPVNSANPNRR